ncbi:unnamed protein product, partial [Prorocentrum cordatum]
EPMGAVKVGLIYVNPEGPLNDPNDLNSGQNPDPEKSAVEIREVFGRMGMNDSETASLIAGGHAFGKCHGAGVMTSGFEGPWTTTPSQWTNQFLTGMLDEEWEQVATPSGSAVQWQTKDRTSILAGTMRLTADLALVNDDAYLALAKHWVCDQQKLDIAFAASWKKLVESGGGWLPVEDRRCEPESKVTWPVTLTSEECLAMDINQRAVYRHMPLTTLGHGAGGTLHKSAATQHACMIEAGSIEVFHKEPMGAVKVGLIYVNPEGPLNDPNDLNSGQNPDPEKSAVEIREVFGRMGMNDSETASLIAGGHAFGKCHGAGVMTSGFEGPWTTTPSQWTNQFLTGMLDEEWEQVATPSGSAVQWQTKDRTSILAGTMRLTADLALVSDDAYLALAKHWVCDQQKLDIAFAASWKKLVESGGGWLPVEDRSDIFGVTDSWQDTDCVVQGNCQEPMGAVKVGLIYVNPEGPLNDPNDLNSGQNPDPEKSAVEIREVFGRMGMNDSETASLIAGGHAFGKCHGAGVMTSGFEGPWTTTPSQWTNQFLTGMLDEEWEQVATPSGSAVQWQTKDRTSILAGTMRLTADLALVNDDAYLALAKHWVCDQQKLDIAFAASWKKLVESGGGWLPVEDRRCEPESKATGQQTDPQKNFHSVCATTTTDDSQEASTATKFCLSFLAVVFTPFSLGVHSWLA